MSSEWSGFTDEDLKRIRGQYSPDSTTSNDSRPVQRTVSLENSLSTEGRQATFQKNKCVSNSPFKNQSQAQKEISEFPLTPQQCLAYCGSSENSMNLAVLKATTVTEMLDIVSNNLNVTNVNMGEIANTKNEEGHSEMNENQRQNEDFDRSSLSCTCVAPKSDEHEPSSSTNKSQEKVALEKFEAKRKYMEAENAKRKKMLLEALDDRKKRTREEAKKIAKIQTELSKLDSMLSCDVGILRNQIEMASLEFTTAEKRYEKAEREFVEAKYALFQKMERKEQLTDYLCTIIEQNEARKANKLSELMHRLDLDSLIEQCQNMETANQPRILNGMTMYHCSEIVPSQVPLSSDASQVDE